MSDKLLTFAWGVRLRFLAVEDRLWAEADTIRAEADALWAEAVIAAHGNIKIEWTQTGSCRLETGEEFRA